MGDAGVGPERCCAWGYVSQLGHPSIGNPKLTEMLANLPNLRFQGRYYFSYLGMQVHLF